MAKEKEMTKQEIIDFIKFGLVEDTASLNEFKAMEAKGIKTGGTLDRYAGRCEAYSGVIKEIDRRKMKAAPETTAAE